MLHTSDLKSIDLTSLKTVFEGADVSRETLAPDALAAGRRLVTKEHRRRMLTLTNARRAARQIAALPERRETLHLLLKANAFAPFDLLPAFVELAGRPASEVWLTSLGINDRHTQALDELLTARRIKKCSLLLSHYFSKVDAEEYAHAETVIRKHGGQIAAVRSHAKLILLRFGRQAHIVCESSGNLRSCRAIEQATVFNDGRLFAWHRAWIRELLARANDPKAPEVSP